MTSATNPKFVVIDEDNGGVGLFASRKEAEAYFIGLARHEEWYDTNDLIDRTGSPFDNDDPAQLHIYEVYPPEPLPNLLHFLTQVRRATSRVRSS